MPKLQQTVLATTTHEIQLKPKVRQSLLTTMKEHALLQAQINALEGQKEALANKAEAILVDVGESTLVIDGYHATLVSGVSKKLNKAKLKPASLVDINRCTEEVPKKSFVKITPPGQGGSHDD